MPDPRPPEPTPDKQGGERTPENRPMASNANAALDPQEGERRSFKPDVERDAGPGGDKAVDKP